MNGVSRLLLTSIMGCVLVMTAREQDSTITGRITDSTGRPIQGVLVARFQQLQGGGFSTDRRETEADGTYHSYGDSRVIFFRKQGFQPVTRVQSLGESVMDVRLERASSDWRLQQCGSSDQLTGKHYGLSVLFPVPPHIAVIAGTPDDDNQKIWLPFPRNKNERLMIWSGALLGGGITYFPDESFFLHASLIKERLDAQTGAMDVRSKDSSGRNSRSLSFVTDIAEYHGISDEAAEFFDVILDSACLRSNKAHSTN